MCYMRLFTRNKLFTISKYIMRFYIQTTQLSIFWLVDNGHLEAMPIHQDKT